MPLFDEEPARKKPQPHTLGEDLSVLSVEDLTSRIGLLRAEIERIESAIAEKKKSRESASSFFKR